ncbi:MAG: hypothetical protein AAF771_16160 [Pseudomonadota bacterium]
MKTTCLTLAVLVLPLGSAAVASQLGDLLDLDDGALTQQQLGQIYAAELGDADILPSQIMAGEIDTGESIAVTPGRRQIAALNDADPMELTLTELAALQLDVDPPLETEPAANSQGKAQLARELGVDPQGYTLAELAKMKFDED